MHDNLIDEAAVEQDLHDRLAKLKAALPEREERVKRYGKWVALAAALVSSIGLVVAITPLVIEASFYLLTLSLTLTLAVGLVITSVAVGVKARTILLVIAWFFATAFLAFITVWFSRYGFHIWTDIIGGLLAGAVSLVIVFGPYASLLAGRFLPSSKFIKRFGLITALFWVPGLLATVYGYVEAIYWAKSEVPIAILLAFSALFGFAVPFIVIIISVKRSADKTRKFIRAGIVFGIICLCIHFLLAIGLIVIAFASWPNWRVLTYLIGLSFIGAGMTMTAATAMSCILIQIAHSKWKKQVQTEIDRLTIELGPVES